MAGEGQLWHRSARAATVSVGPRPLADAEAAFLLGRRQAKMSRALVTQLVLTPALPPSCPRNSCTHSTALGRRTEMAFI